MNEDIDKWLKLGWVLPTDKEPTLDAYYICLYWNQELKEKRLKALGWNGKSNRETIEFGRAICRAKGDYGSFIHDDRAIRDIGFQWFNENRTNVVPQHVYCYWPQGSNYYTMCGREFKVPSPYTEDLRGYEEHQEWASKQSNQSV